MQIIIMFLVRALSLLVLSGGALLSIAAIGSGPATGDDLAAVLTLGGVTLVLAFALWRVAPMIVRA
ncbi:MAG: hypothetical protein AAF220_04935 [Pseudomonadota bacterium]